MLIWMQTWSPGVAPSTRRKWLLLLLLVLQREGRVLALLVLLLPVELGLG